MLKMEKLILQITFVVGMLGCLTSAQVISWGKCPSVTVQQNFDINRYMGTWYEQERFFAIFEAWQICGTAKYALQADGVVSVNNTGYNKLTKRYKTAIGDATVEDPSTPAKLGVKFFDNQPRGDYWVLSTDYDSYTVVWSCGDLGFLNTQFAWILSRSPNGIPDSKRDEIYAMLTEFGINTRKFNKPSQQNCPGRV